jgi:hypothetical protein
MIGMPDKTPRKVDDGITLIMALKATSDWVVELAQLPMWTTATMLSIRF